MYVVCNHAPGPSVPLSHTYNGYWIFHPPDTYLGDEQILHIPGRGQSVPTVTELIFVYKARARDKTYIWVSVWWKTKNENWGIYTPHIHWVVRGTGTPKDRDEVNRREVCECDGWVCDLGMTGAPTKLSVIRKVATLARMLPTCDWNRESNVVWWKWKYPRSDCASWTPEAAKKRSVSWWACENKSDEEIQHQRHRTRRIRQIFC
jgi:hypothetical protein